MLSKNNRVDKVLFNSILKEGFALHSPFLTFRYLKSLDFKAHFAVVAPKSTAKGAVKRNSMRRQGYRVIGNITPLPPISAVIMYKKQAIDAKSEDIKGDLDILLTKIRI